MFKVGDKVLYKGVSTPSLPHHEVGYVCQVEGDTITCRYLQPTWKALAINLELVESGPHIDSLTKKERDAVDCARRIWCTGSNQDPRILAVIAIIDRLAPKPIEYVLGWDAISDMRTRESARYKFCGVTYRMVGNKLERCDRYVDWAVAIVNCSELELVEWEKIA